jgi:hypothetical protein
MNIVFVFNEYSLHNHIVEEYVRVRPAARVSLVKIPLVLKGKGRRATAASILPALSRRYTIAKAVEFGIVLAITALPKFLGRGAVFRRLRRIASIHSLPFHRSESVMAPGCLEFIRSQDPDVVVTLVHQIVREPLISMPRLGVVNIHPGLLPEFRGIQPYLWELSEGSNRAGSTLHLIADETVDTGPVLAHASYAVRPRISVQLNYYLSSVAAAHLLPGCLDALESGESVGKQQDQRFGRYFRWPDGAAIDRLGRRGHRIFSPSDLRDILTGRYDGFEADDHCIHRT